MQTIKATSAYDRPTTPSEEDCCGQGCDPCIFDVHRSLLRDYERRKEQERRANSLTDNLLHPSLYTSFTIISIQQISKDYLLLSLIDTGEVKPNKSLLIHPGQYVILRAWNLTRPFTPISWADRKIDFLVKLYPGGKFTTHLAASRPADKIDIRGPYGQYRYLRNSFQHLVMFTIGSGIAAVYPIANAILNDEDDMTRVHLIGGFQTISCIPLRKQLQRLCDYWNFQCTLHISQSLDSNAATPIHGISIKDGRLTEQSVCTLLNNNQSDRTFILICGTQQFNRMIEQSIQAIGYLHFHVFKSH